MNTAQRRELELLADEDDILTPQRVVEFATDPETALHTAFEWDDTEAGRLFRIQQARSVIRVWVIRHPGIARDIRAQVSVPSDRATTGGYRPVGSVMASPAWSAEMFGEVEAKIRNLRKSYAYLPFLEPLWDRLEAVVAAYRLELGQRNAAG